MAARGFCAGSWDPTPIFISRLLSAFTWKDATGEVI
jgi:hypothetical protein